MEAVLEYLRGDPGQWALAIVFAAAALEYMVPPLPADTVVLAGALLVVAGAHDFTTVAAAAVAGGVVGSLTHYWLGRSLGRPDGSVRGGRYIDRLVGAGSMERFFEVFRKYGMWLIAMNRAFPGVRAVTFFAAGAARLPLIPTMAYGLLSNVAWTLAVLTLGVTVGRSWEKIEAVFRVYKLGVYGVGSILLVAFVSWRLWRRSRQRAEATVIGSADPENR